MRYLVSASLVLAGIIHLLPLSGAIGAGRLTTVAVVQSIFLVIFADALFAIFYLEIDF